MDGDWVSQSSPLKPQVGGWRVVEEWAHSTLKLLKKSKRAYMRKASDVAEMAVLAKKNLRKKCVNCDKM